jgi:hypothetical protein
MRWRGQQLIPECSRARTGRFAGQQDLACDGMLVEGNRVPTEHAKARRGSTERLVKDGEAKVPGFGSCNR